MIDIAPWKTNDDEWKAKRDAEWPVFENWLAKKYSQESDRLLKESIDKSKIFYDHGIFDDASQYHAYRNVTFYESLTLHPALTSSALREIMCIEIFLKQSLKGYFGRFYLLKPQYTQLIEKGFLPVDFILTLLKGFYGCSLYDAAKILEFEPKAQAFNVVDNLGPTLFAYFFADTHEYLTADTATYMRPFYLEALPLLTEEEAEKCDFIFKQHVKRKLKFYDSGKVKDPIRRKFMEELLKGIKASWSDLNPIVQEKLSPLVD